MTLTEYPELEQGSDAWLEQRRGMCTASVVGRLVTPKTIKPANNPDSRTLTMQLVAERVSGWTDPVWVTDDMQRGNDDEPRARDLYAAHYGVEVATTGFLVEDRFGWSLGYSPDGLVGTDGLIEVKSRKAKKHVATIVEDAVPIENMAQIQAGLLVSGRDWCDYLSYCSGLPMWRKRVEPDEKWFAAIVDAAGAFEAAASRMVAEYEGRVVGLPSTERIDDLEMVI